MSPTLTANGLSPVEEQALDHRLQQPGQQTGPYGLRFTAEALRDLERLRWSERTYGRVRELLRQISGGAVASVSLSGMLDGLHYASVPTDHWRVYFLPGPPAEVVAVLPYVSAQYRRAAALRASQREASLGYYKIDWAWQAEMDRRGGGERNSHDLTKTRTLPLLLRLAEQVMADHKVPGRVVIERIAPGWSEADYDPVGEVATLRLDNDMRTKWVVLHEMAHVLIDHESDEMAAYDQHGPVFRRVFSGLLRRYGGVDVSLDSAPARRTTSAYYKINWAKTAMPMSLGMSQVPDANWVRMFDMTGEKQYTNNQPYMTVAFQIPTMGEPGSGNTETKVPVPWNGDLKKVLAEAERKARAYYGGREKDMYDKWLAQGGGFRLMVGSTLKARYIAQATKIGDWKPPSPGDRSWPDFLALMRADPTKAWDRFCKEVCDAQPPGYVSHPLYDPAKVRKTTIYRGIIVGQGVDPATSHSRATSGMGTSWTLDLAAAQAIAERGGAGFTSGIDKPGATRDMRIKDNNDGPGKGNRPVVLRSEVDLTKDGVALFTDGRMYYVSEQEVHVAPDTEILLTGTMEATIVAEDRKEQAEAQRLYDLAEATRYKEGDHWAKFKGHYQWPSTFKTMKIKRTASKTAATQTLYRGVYVELSGDDLDSGNTNAINALLVQKATSGTGVDTIGRSLTDAGAGQHWTTNKAVAIQFATPMTRHGATPALGSDGWTVSVPVVLTATASTDDVVTDEEALRDAMVEGHGWTGMPSTTRLPEDEVLMRPGAPVQIISIEALAPRSWAPVRNALFVGGGSGSVEHMKVAWKRIGGGMRVTADRNERWVQCDQGHEHWGAEGAAGVLIRHTDDDGTVRYLLQHRAAWVDHGNTWSIPGGAIDSGETPVQAALREAREEMGVALPRLRYVRTVTDDHGGWAYSTVIMEADERFADSATFEQGGVDWFTAEEIARLFLHPGFAGSWSKVRTAKVGLDSAAADPVVTRARPAVLGGIEGWSWEVYHFGRAPEAKVVVFGANGGDYGLLSYEHGQVVATEHLPGSTSQAAATRAAVRLLGAMSD